MFKPSTLWPPPPDDFRERAEQSTSLSGLKKASTEFHDKAAKHKKSFFSITTANKKGRQLAEEVGKIPDDPQRAEGDLKHTGQRQTKGEVGKRIKLKIDGEEVELVDQIQLYATNEQVSYVVMFSQLARNAADSRAARVPLRLTGVATESRRSPSSLYHGAYIYDSLKIKASG